MAFRNFSGFCRKQLHDLRKPYSRTNSGECRACKVTRDLAWEANHREERLAYKRERKRLYA